MYEEIGKMRKNTDENENVKCFYMFINSGLYGRPQRYHSMGDMADCN